MPLNALEIQNEITARRQRASEHMSIWNDEARPEDERGQARDAALRLDGEVAALDERLRDAIAEQDAELVRMRALPDASAGAGRAASLSAQFLGARSDYDPVALVASKGTSRRVSIPRSALVAPATPVVGDLSVPQVATDVLLSFVDTLAQGRTNAAISYLQATSFTNGAGVFAVGTAKPESSIEWTPKTANIETLAHWVPVSKQQVKYYGQMADVIDNTLMIGLRQKEDAHSLHGSNANGVIGVCNTVGIQTHTSVAGDNASATIRRMITKCLVNSGYYPTHACVSPYVKENMDLLKDSDGDFLYVNLRGIGVGIPIVEDLNMMTVTTTGSGDQAVTTTHNGALVYFGKAATWYTAEDDAISIGLTGSQFVENAYTVLAEGDHLLKMQSPKAFVYCQDAIPAVTS